ncbi:hypothetical protein ZTR_03042 [Talaromyces verruculosus]|nr:hypothetical protein ZTR_03042 [Talaromyces verruculosus]
MQLFSSTRFLAVVWGLTFAPNVQGRPAQAPAYPNSPSARTVRQAPSSPAWIENLAFPPSNGDLQFGLATKPSLWGSPDISKITGLPEAMFLNGVAKAESHHSHKHEEQLATVLIADSVLGAVWKVNPNTGEKSVVGSTTSMTVAGSTSAGFGGDVLYVTTDCGMAAPVNGTIVEAGKIVAIQCLDV